MAVREGAHRDSNVAYRLMLLEYRILARLGLMDPIRQLSRMGVRPGSVVADWGCGPGRVTIPLAKAVGEDGVVIALDVQALALVAVAEKAAKEGLKNIRRVLVEAYPVPVESSTVDLVVMLDAFHAISDRAGVLREIARVLKPGGRLFMDPGHMDLEVARRHVEESGRFQLLQAWDRDMLLGLTEPK